METCDRPRVRQHWKRGSYKYQAVVDTAENGHAIRLSADEWRRGKLANSLRCLASRLNLTIHIQRDGDTAIVWCEKRE